MNNYQHLFGGWLVFAARASVSCSMIKRGLNTGLRDHVMDEAARFVCVLYYRGRLGTTVNYKFIVFFENHAYPMPLPGHTQHTPFRHAR